MTYYQKMAPLLILIISFSVTWIVNRIVLKNRLNLSFIGRLSMAIMLLITGMAHFTTTDLMIEMMPDIVPFKMLMIYFTGILEVLASIGLLNQKSSKLASILLIVFFLAVLPANVTGSLKEVALGGMEKGADYLYFRIPLQIGFMAWAYYFGIKINKITSNIRERGT